MRRYICAIMRVTSCFRVFLGSAIALTIGLGTLAAQDYSAADLVGAATRDEMVRKGGISAVSSDGLPKLLPRQAGADLIRAALAAEKPQVLVEALFFYPRPEPSGAAAQSAELAAIYGLMRSFSTLRGIKYFSHSQQSMQTLYVDAYRVSAVEGGTRIEDPDPPSPGQIPATERFDVFLQDQRFGKNVYRYDFTNFADGILVESTNETQMTYLIFPVFAPGKLKMRLLLVPANDGIIFYVESGAGAPGFLRSRIGESFQNRAAALFGWFRDRFKEPEPMPEPGNS